MNLQFLTDAQGRRLAAVIPIKEYENLLENLADLAAIAERRDEPRVSLEDLRKQLKAEGLLPE